jgi:hypothetical protein
MSNMSYCRFENTLPDLIDCAEALENIDGNLAELSKSEAKKANELIQLCVDIAQSYGSDLL